MGAELTSECQVLACAWTDSTGGDGESGLVKIEQHLGLSQVLLDELDAGGLRSQRSTDVSKASVEVSPSGNAALAESDGFGVREDQGDLVATVLPDGVVLRAELPQQVHRCDFVSVKARNNPDFSARGLRWLKTPHERSKFTKHRQRTNRWILLWLGLSRRLTA